MRRKMEYHIISGSVIETRRCYLSDSGKRVRGVRKAGNTSLQKIFANEREAVRRLARILNTNFGEGFLFVTLKYDNDRLPADYDKARETAEKFLRKARAAHEKAGGEKLRYVMVTANWNPKSNRPARLHHHIIMDVSSIDTLSRLWPAGQFHVERRSGLQDLSALADYMYRNVRGLEKGKKRWTACKGMEKPIYTEPKPVDDINSVEPVPGTSIVDAYQTTDEEGSVTGSYVRAICHEKIRYRGGMVILPKRKKKRERVPLDIAELTTDDE